GVFYTWQAEELKTRLESDYEDFAAAYGVTKQGNFEGRNILHRLNNECQFTDEANHAKAREKLHAARNKRPRPPCDDKILADWNGLMIATLARLALCFARPDWLTHATQAYDFIRQNMCIADENGLRLYHLFRPHIDKSKMSHHTVSLAEDYANTINAALALFSTTGKQTYLRDSEDFASYLDAQFWDKDTGGYYMTAQNAEKLIMRPHHANDNATPSANSTMISNLTRLACFTGKQAYMDKAYALIAHFAPLAEKNFPHMTHYLTQLQNACQPVTCVIIGTDAPSDKEPDKEKDYKEKDYKEKNYQPLLETDHKHSLPSLAIQVIDTTQTLAETHPAYGKTLQQGKATAYLCRGQTCLAPIVTTADLTAQLDAFLEKGF
ncbi:MAG: thioredoxin domain-containing protein, partial [Alphaproteobacteria bacterium]|nr:thioredoxin domain-containing protein [Alphaproteobacteria bacterium]